MSSLSKMMVPRSEPRSSEVVDLPKKPRKPSQARPVRPSAACRALYANPKCKAASSAQASTPRRASVGHGDQDEDDPTIKYSMYPQMIGKRRSELEAQVRTRSAKYDRTPKDEDMTRVGRLSRQQQPLSRVRSDTVESDLSFSSGCSSDGNPEGRPVRVCIYPQAKYIKEPVKVPLEPERISAKFSTNSSSRARKRSSLPGDEYQILVRRQKMQRAREALESHYVNQKPVQGRHIWHGLMQGFTIRNSERRRISKMRYAVRKAMQAGIDPTDDDFRLAMNRHADRVHFSELSDVDGVPIDDNMISEFMRVYQQARNAAIAANLLDPLRGKSMQRTWVDERNHRVRQAARLFQQVESVVTVEASTSRPKLVSRFSWDSNDGEIHVRKRLTKTKR